MTATATPGPSSISPAPTPPSRRCRSCDAPLVTLFVDLGMSPPCEDFLTEDRLHGPETFYPLDVRICDRCLLVQMPAYVSPQSIFREYAYFSSYSASWVDHAGRFVEEAIRRQALGPGSRLVEIASNDGYLLQHVMGRGISVLGVEPARNIALVAEGRGIPTLNEFFSLAVANRIVETSGQADFVVANNVFAHVPDLNDFTAGLQALLRPGGLLSIEVAYLARLIRDNEFDTIYHEHLMYYSVLSAESVLARHGLRILDVEELDTHGGSIRLWVAHADDPRPSRESVEALKARERAAGLHVLAGYEGFASGVEETKRDLLTFLLEERQRGAVIAGYGAPGKGNTLLNYCGIRPDLVGFLVDRNPYKHGRYTPGTHIPIFPTEHLDDVRPDIILIMPWNLRDEIARDLAYTRSWGARLVVAIPRLEILE
jgi:SAM-dependent methyltransferase